MNKTKEVISNFMSKTGHHDTTVHESVNPAVQHETVRPSQHEEINTAIDKEIHQDHYHHTVQPIQDREVLPEQHHHNLGQTEHRHLDHRDEAKTRAHLDAEAAKYMDESRRMDTSQTQSHAPVVQGEHVHHHVHETYQPVIHKETVEPHVVHTTVPIHETHHNTAQHHATSTLPAISLGEFQQHGGTRSGGQHDHHRFEGVPDTSDTAFSGSNRGIQHILSSGHTVSGNATTMGSAIPGTTTATRGGAVGSMGTQGGAQSSAATAAATAAMEGATHQKGHVRADSAKGLDDLDPATAKKGTETRNIGSVFDKVNLGR
ncbi:hypothetical protein E8E14_009773 [Neopestalotiopsis sp. 37M]|nr:hypothetical protein E8E14_009773 [Neopestalotiopsis sp. 37M]